MLDAGGDGALTHSLSGRAKGHVWGAAMVACKQEGQDSLAIPVAAAGMVCNTTVKTQKCAMLQTQDRKPPCTAQSL